MRLLIALVALGLSGCADKAALEAATKKAEAAEAAASAAEGELAKLKERLTDLELQHALSQASGASVSTESKLYGVANTTQGKVLVAVDSVTPYLDGFKVKLRIGNLMSASFDGAKLTVVHAKEKSSPTDLPGVETKEIQVTDTFRSGAWTNTEVVLSPAKASQIKRLNVQVEFDNVRLLRP